jgi:hypothetical protein
VRTKTTICFVAAALVRNLFDGVPQVHANRVAANVYLTREQLLKIEEADILLR